LLIQWYDGRQVKLTTINESVLHGLLHLTIEGPDLQHLAIGVPNIITLDISDCDIYQPITIGDACQKLRISYCHIYRPLTFDFSPALTSLRELGIRDLVSVDKGLVTWNWTQHPIYDVPERHEHALKLHKGLSRHRCDICDATVYEAWSCPSMCS
jgi:hypothetical protein